MIVPARGAYKIEWFIQWTQIYTPVMFITHIFKQILFW